MRPQLFLSRMRLGHVMIVSAVGLMLMTSLPANAAEHSFSGNGAAENAGGPFASVDTELNAAVSRALRRADLPEVPATANVGEAARLPRGLDWRTPGPGNKLRAANLRAARERVDRLLPVIRPILRKAGVPAQLAAVVLVESGGNPRALSPKGARGLWQLMPDTARDYGLMVNGKVDQRLNVIESTRAAAEYLHDLYAEFHSWKLALAAYNAGDQAVHRAMFRTGGDAFATVSAALPAETQEYVPAVFSAIRWFRDPVLSRSANGAHLGPVADATGE